MPGGRAFTAEGEGEPFEVGQLGDIVEPCANDELAVELGIARSLGNRFSARDNGLCLHAGEATKPGELDITPLEGGDERGIVDHWHVLDVQARRLRQIVGHRPELPIEHRDVLIGDRADGEGAIVRKAAGVAGIVVSRTGVPLSAHAERSAPI